MIVNRFPAISLIAFALAASMFPATGQVTFRRIANMTQYSQPSLLTEVSPGTFLHRGVVGSGLFRY